MIRSTLVHRRALVTVVAAVLVMASCSSDDDASEASDETTTTTAAAETNAPPTTLSPEEEVEAAYREWEALMAELAPAPNPDDPRLADMVLDPLLTELRDGLAQRQLKNEVYEIGPQSSHEIISTTIASTGITATVLLCSVGDDKLVDADTGHVLNEGTHTNKNKLSYRNQDGRWMIDDFETLDSWTGVTTCET